MWVCGALLNLLTYFRPKCSGFLNTISDQIVYRNVLLLSAILKRSIVIIIKKFHLRIILCCSSEYLSVSPDFSSNSQILHKPYAISKSIMIPFHHFGATHTFKTYMRGNTPEEDSRYGRSHL